ncbi:jg13972 [Pararge aegeria aegeria]|uniref:Exocyst complex component Sec8 n=1 Tax=Pararge aegeria aegeria TaxID=348720 RepID=A0A8S4R871_9NEOP|nr:jg13972 [Pararge aegeria aegeria]
MSSPPPTKPPRGVKQGKETSGLLMSVIRTLSASETNEQREKERAKLEKEYKKSDARLDELVAAHAQEMTDVMQKFSAVSTALGAWGQHCAAAEARLGACRALLRVRRDDLRRLWADARTHHHALRMLTDIERVVVSEREARELAAAGRVLAAAHALQAALLTARTELPHVHALSATTAHLEAKKKELVDIIVRRISEAVYRDERAPLSRRVSARRRTALLLAELTKSEEVTDAYLQDITPEFEASLTEEDKTFETTVMISLEALGVLEQLKEATEKFKVQIQNELLEVIDSVSRRIIEDVEIEVDIEGEEDGEMFEAEGVTEMGRPLARLVSCLAEEFKACGTRNKRLLQLWRAALQKHRISEQCLHTEQNYWSAVQQVELKQAYEREAEILGTSLGDGEVSKREIVADINTLVDLALLCESMDWLSTNIKTIPAIVSAPSGFGAGLKLNEKFHAYIASAARNFESIAHKCLLFLHLEMRIECFHYLGQEEKVEGSESSEQSGGAGGASRLAHRLLAFHEHASALLADSALAICPKLDIINIYLFPSDSLDRGLTGIDTNIHLQEIITSVREKGPQFSELEYLNAFKVIGARRGLAPADMRAQLKQLSAALGHVGVTV